MKLQRLGKTRPVEAPTEEFGSPSALPPALDQNERVKIARNTPKFGAQLETLLSQLFQGRRRAVAAVMAGISLAPLTMSGATLKETGPRPIPAPVQVQTTSTIATPGFRIQVAKGVRGAYFRKVSSEAQVHFGGIRARGKLPTPNFDPDRQYVAKAGLDHFSTGPLERPSVYLGGRASGHEVDAGLTWDRVYDPQGQATYTDRAGCDGRDPTHRFVFAKKAGERIIKDGNGQVVAEGEAAVTAFAQKLRPNFAFRPYWRTTNPGEEDWKQPKPGRADNVHFYPGEAITMEVKLLGPGQVQLQIEGASQFVVDFHQTGWGGAKTAHAFKRVNAVDQFQVLKNGERKGREKQDVLPTGTTAKGAEWSSVELLDRRGEVLTPMTGPKFTEVRGADLAQRYDQVFVRGGFTKTGGEKLDILPGGR
jgi:hypothetical protein